MKALDNTLPFNFGFLEIDQKAQAQIGGSQIVEALRGVLTGETIHTFQLNHQFVLDEDVGEILSDVVAFIYNSQ